MRLLLAAVASTSLALAQTPPPPAPPAAPDRATLQTRLMDKLAQPFLLLHAWHTDLESAKRAAAREG